MRARLEFLTGNRAGQAALVADPYVTLGRHPMCTIPFDADEETQVSGRHAAIFREGDLYVLRDLGSTNGTFVNGQRLRADHILADDDLIQLGQHGPRLAVALVRDDDTPPYQPAVPSPNRFSTIPPRRTHEESRPEEPRPTPEEDHPGAPVDSARRQPPPLRRVGLWIALGVIVALIVLGLLRR